MWWREVSDAPSHDVLLGDNPDLRQMWIRTEVWQATRKSGLTLRRSRQPLTFLFAVTVLDSLTPSIVGPGSVLTFDTFHHRPEGGAEWLKAGEPCREAEIGKAENNNEEGG